MFKDPVCGMELDKDDSILVEYKGKKYHFCSDGCRKRFFEAEESSAQNKYDRKNYKLAIIGGGPAGLTAGVYSSILHLDSILISKDIGGQALDSVKVKNYMGFDFISGEELVKKFTSQLLNDHYLAHIIDEVLKISKSDGKFIIKTINDEYTVNAIIIATGMKRRKLGIPGEDRFKKRGVSHSLVQDITLFSGLRIVVVGGGNSGVQTANALNDVAQTVIIISKGDIFADPEDITNLRKSGVSIKTGYVIKEINGYEKIKSVTIVSENESITDIIECDAVFIQIGMMPNNEFCRDLVELNQKGEIVIGHGCTTATPGLFACGDVTNTFGKRIIIASGEGAQAALKAQEYLTNKKNKM